VIEAGPIWGLIAFGSITLLCLLSLPIAASMGVVGVTFLWLFYGDFRGIFLAGMKSFSIVKSYSLSMIPLFVLMGTLIGEAGLGRNAYDCFYKWLGKIRGGLAVTATFTSALFGCITGSVTATIGTIGGISSPEMKRRGYSPELRLGSIAVAGILANLIPPSLIAILYCTIVETSVGKVFIAGLIPGIILTILFSITVRIWVAIRPSIAPIATEDVTLKDKVKSLRGPLPIIIIFLFMIGGIFSGWFSPTEAAGIGVAYALAMTLIMKRLTWERFRNAGFETVRITTFVMVIIMGSLLFGNMIAVTRLPQYVAEVMARLELPPQLLLFSIIGFFIVLGCVLDGLSIMVLFTPLFYPTILELGFSPIWYGTLTVMLVDIAGITPPVAGNIYVTQSLDPEATTIQVVRGVLPFYAASLLLVVLLVFLPQIATWLPNAMY